VGVFPLLAAVLALAFAGVLTGRYLRRRRPHEAVWAVALAMYAVASFAVFLGVGGGWTPSLYRVYWLLGVALNVPFLALGEAFLLVRRRAWTTGLLVLVLAASALSVTAAWGTPLHRPVLERTLPRGSEAWGTGTAAYNLRWLSWAGYVALLVGLVWSARAMQRHSALRRRAAGVLWIALGATVVAVGSGVGAGFEVVWLFAAGLAAGMAVMFWGFLLASRRPAPR
jgi:hypothetical protein